MPAYEVISADDDNQQLLSHGLMAPEEYRRSFSQGRGPNSNTTTIGSIIEAETPSAAPGPLPKKEESGG